MLGERQLVERLAEVDLRRGGKAVGALAEIDLVDVELQDLVLGEARSILNASSISLNLRVSVFSFDRKKLRATCIVMVLAPWRTPPETKFDSAARATPM